MSSPIGGLNSKDTPETMPETDALVFDNAISTAGHVEMRRGYSVVCNVGSNPISTVFQYTRGDDKYLLFCTMSSSGNGEIYAMDENYGVYLLAPPTGYHINGDHFFVCNFSNRIFLSSMDGTDLPMMFDGERLSLVPLESKRPEIQTFRLRDVQSFCSYKKRLFFIERFTSKIWYLYTAGELYGECEVLDTSQVSGRGGYLVALNEWSRAGNDETQSLLSAITSEGESLIYSGDDPSGEDWQLTSKTQMPDIVGWRNTVSYKDDVAVMTKGGLYTLNSVVGSATTQKEQSLSDKIIGSIKELKSSYYRDYWQVVYLVSLNWILINVPMPDSTFVQYVCNLENNTWSHFIGIQSVCWSNWIDDVYFGSSTGDICKFNDSGRDGEDAIRMFVQTAYTVLESPNNKKVQELSLYLYSAFRRDVEVNTYVDYNPQTASNVYLQGTDGTRMIGQWNKSHWGQDVWGSSLRFTGQDVQKLTTPVFAQSGRRVSFGVGVEGNDMMQSDTVWLSSDIRFEPGEY
jgi:hypothetical protein